MTEPLNLTTLAVDDATAAVEDMIQSVHVYMVPWCGCCAARVEIDHICSCEVT